MDIYVKLAQDTISSYLLNNKLPKTDGLPEELLNKKAGCFVSIHNKNDGELRGCIGTILPVYKNLASEIISNAISAATNDPRFPSIIKNELDNITINVDILSEPEAINSEKDLDPRKFGVIVKSQDGRTGLLLPDLEGINTIERQIEIARQKADILPEENISLYRFTVNRHS